MGIRIYCDGGAEPNPGRGGYGAVILDGERVLKELKGFEEKTTNNRMELTAALMALRELPEGTAVQVVTDSQYVKKGITEWIRGWIRKGWRTASGGEVQNVDLWMALLDAADRRTVTWSWTKGHAGNRWNERADQLATAGRKEGPRAGGAKVPAPAMPSRVSKASHKPEAERPTRRLVQGAAPRAADGEEPRHLTSLLAGEMAALQRSQTEAQILATRPPSEETGVARSELPEDRVRVSLAMESQDEQATRFVAMLEHRGKQRMLEGECPGGSAAQDLLFVVDQVLSVLKRPVPLEFLFARADLRTQFERLILGRPRKLLDFEAALLSAVRERLDSHPILVAKDAAESKVWAKRAKSLLCAKPSSPNGA